MTGFEFLTINNDLPSEARGILDELAAAFNRQSPSSPITINNLSWSEAWQHLMHAALYKKGPTVSEIGAPWTSDFVSMNSLRPFEPDEIELFGGQSAYPAIAWANCQAGRGSQTWSIPTRADLSVVFYWKDMVEAAGIDPHEAFSTAERFENTLKRLQANGMERPLSMVTSLSRSTVYRAASWIWGAGGDIIDPAGRLAFHQPAAQAGLRALFSLHRFLASDAHSQFDGFLNRRTGVVVQGYGILSRFRANQGVPWSNELDALLMAALLPGPSFVGGTNLVVWQHASPESVTPGLKFMEQWTHSSAMLKYCCLGDLLPAREDLLSALEAKGDPRVLVLIDAMRKGRTPSHSQIWVPVAERLGGALGWVWAELRKNPGQDIGRLVAHATEAAFKRLEHSLY